MNVPTGIQHLPSKSHQLGRVGSVVVEMAILAPLLIFLLFGIVEMGLVLKNQLVLNSACREAARVAGIGSPTAQIIARARVAATTLPADQITGVPEYRSYAPDTGWSEWQPLGDTGDLSANAAPTNSQIKVTLTYPHSLITGLMVLGFGADPSTRIVTLYSAVVIRRE